MQTRQAEALAKVLCDILQKLAFVFPEPADKQRGLPPFRGACVLAQIRFGGAQRGELALVAPVVLCHTLAANILGVEPSHERAQGLWDDALKELVDNVCAHLLTTLAGTEPVFELGVPSTQQLNLAELEAFLSDPQSAGFCVEDQPLLARFIMDA